MSKHKPIGQSILNLPKAYKSFKNVNTDIRIPAGCPPFKLKDKPTKSEINEWIHKIRLHYLRSSKAWLSNEGLCYFINDFYEIGSAEHTYLCKMINKSEDIQRSSV